MGRPGRPASTRRQANRGSARRRTGPGVVALGRRRSRGPGFGRGGPGAQPPVRSRPSCCASTRVERPQPARCPAGDRPDRLRRSWNRRPAVASGHVRAFPPSAPALLSRRSGLQREVPGQGARACRRTCSSSTSRTPSPRWRRRPPGPRSWRPSRDQDWGDAVLCVRVNAWDTRWTYGDVIEVVGQAGPRLDEIMLPKVQSAAEVVAMDLLLTQVEINSGLPPGHIGIEAQIETARGLINVEEICAASPAARDGHPRSGRLLGLDGDAVAGGRAAHTGVPGRLLPLRVHEDPDGRPGQRAAGHRRSLRQGPRPGGLPRVRPADADPRFRRKVEPAPRPGRRSSTRCSRPPRSSSTGPWEILDAYREATEGERKGAVMLGDEMIDEASREGGGHPRRPGRAGRAEAPVARCVLTTWRSCRGDDIPRQSATLHWSVILACGWSARRSIRRRATTFRARVSSAPSKIDSTRASTNSRLTGNSSA